MKFYGLHCHSSYSLLDGIIKIDDYIEWAKKHKIDALALTEHGTLSSAYELWDKCNKADIKPILGIEAYYVDDAHKEEGLILSSYSHICLWAKNKTGWENLKKLQAFAWSKGFYKKPRLDWESIKKHREGLIASTACTGGLIGSILLPNKYYTLFGDKARARLLNQRIERFKSLFGQDFYLEIMFNDLADQKILNKRVIELSKEHKVKVIITNDSHYVNPSDSILHDIIKVTQFKKTLQDSENGTYDTKCLYLVGLKGLDKLRNEHHRYISTDRMMEYVKNSSDIVKKVEKYNILGDKSSLPKFADGAFEMLKSLCIKGKVKLKDDWDKTYDIRLKYELEVINKLKMSDYFLIVWDIAREARKRNIPFNTRGSVAGSLVANLIGISWIDPIKFGTTFERFLTDDRLTLPDIDMDFGTERRDELIQYLCEKYGEECVAHIVNFSIYKPKQAIKDASRAYGIPFHIANRITGLIPDGTEKWEDVPAIDEISKFFVANPDVSVYAKKMLGLIRHRGVHASGVVLTPGNIRQWLPVAYSLKNEESMQDKVVEFDMYMLDDNNILKLDFLGQNTLDIIQYTLKLIDGEMKSFDDLYRVILKDLTNKKVFKNLQNGNLTGIFQMGGSTGMQELVKQIKPRTVDDISIAIALYRTAILKVGGHEKYVRRRDGREQVRYLHPKMESILKETHGILLFQEQCLAGDMLIKTEIGDIKIKDIVDNKMNIKVYTINEDTGDIELKRIDNHYDNGMREIFEIKLDDGNVLKCTDNHKVLTNRGWVMVKHLNENDDIISVS